MSLPQRRIVELGDGERLSYLQAGTGPDVVLIHGTIVTAPEMALSLLEPLAGRYRVTIVDRPGQSGSTRRRFGGTPQAQAATIWKGIEALGLTRPIIVGHSLGGTVAVHLGLDHPDAIGGLVIISPLVFPEPRLETFLFGLRGLAGFGELATMVGGIGPDVLLLPALWRAMFLPQDMPERFRAEFPFDEVRQPQALQATGEDSVQTPAALAASVARYALCNVRSHVLLGEADIVANPRVHGRTLAHLMPGAKLTTVPELGHMLHHFRPDLVVDAVDDLAHPHSNVHVLRRGA